MNTAPEFPDAPCKGHTRLFFGVDGERADQKADRIRQAKNLCDACPHIEPCRQWAIDNNEFGDWSGIWGGTTPLERRMGKRRERAAERRRAALCGSIAGLSQHRRYGEPACPACRAAKRAYDARRKENAA